MLTIRDLTKTYGSVKALDDVSLDVRPGTIHAVVGENGAGKSTLVSVLAGFVTPDHGRINYSGTELPLGKPSAVKRLGIEMVHQHFTLVPGFTVAQNLALSRLPRLFSRANPASIARPALDLAETLGWKFDPRASVAELPVGVKQRIEILKALAGDAKVLILDEPTAVLAPHEVKDLFSVLARLRAAGTTVILIAHKLREVLSVADRITVLRKGKVIGEADREETDEHKLAEWMIGEIPSALPKGVMAKQALAMEVKNLSVRGRTPIKNVSFEVYKGEVLGIGGVDGNGQVELAETLALVRKPSFGSVLWRGGESSEGTRGNLNSVGFRLVYIPQDRQAEGLALEMSVEDNLLLGGLRNKGLRWGPFLLHSKVRHWAAGLIERFSIRTRSISDSAASLSGGNQQKVVVARNLGSAPDVLIAVNPARGLDIQATNFVYGQILNARNEGAAVVLFSTDLDELAALADRTLFMSRGTLKGSMQEALGGDSG